MLISLLELHVLGEAVDVADIQVMIIVGHVEGGRSARGIDVATRVMRPGLTADDLGPSIISLNTNKSSSSPSSAMWWERHVTPQPEHMSLRDD